MAEFQEVMKQAKRMCEAHEACYKCPLKNHSAMCAGNKNLSCIASKRDVSKLERIVMDWAAANQEPRYPSWNEAWRQLFPGAERAYVPCRLYFVDKCPHDYVVSCRTCDECKSQPIPADIADKLGIKPIGGVSDENA